MLELSEREQLSRIFGEGQERSTGPGKKTGSCSTSAAALPASCAGGPDFGSFAAGRFFFCFGAGRLRFRVAGFKKWARPYINAKPRKFQEQTNAGLRRNEPFIQRRIFENAENSLADFRVRLVAKTPGFFFAKLKRIFPEAKTRDEISRLYKLQFFFF